MKPGSNMQLSKKSLAEELAGRVAGAIHVRKIRGGRKTTARTGVDADFRGRPLDRARSGQNPVQHGVPEGTARCRDICRTPHAPGRTDGAAPRARRPARPGRSAENTGSRDRRKSAERRTAHDAAVLEKHLAERGATAAAGALQACIEADVNFHIALAEATHNEILCELYRSTAAHLKKRFSNIYRDTECLLATQPTHGQLLGYILAGDVRNAREAITRILEEP